LEDDHLTKRVLDVCAGVRDYWLAHPIDCVIAIFPEIVIDFQAILEKLLNSSAASAEKQA
jgi:hypothetical protein